MERRSNRSGGQWNVGGVGGKIPLSFNENGILAPDATS